MRFAIFLRCGFTAVAACALAAQAAPAQTTPAAPSDKKVVAAKSNFEPQSKLATAQAFSVVSADLPVVKSALDAKNLEGAKKIAGKAGTFVGTVTKVYSPDNHSIVILDFDAKYREALTATLKPALYAKFPNLDSLQGKRILVTGTFTIYHDAPLIELTDPAQIKVIAADKSAK